MAEYRVSAQAEQDLYEIYRYGVSAFGMRQADAFLDTLFDCFEMIANGPLTWPLVDHVKPGYRRYVLRSGGGRTPIYYRIASNDVEIMAVIQRQDATRRGA